MIQTEGGVSHRCRAIGQFEVIIYKYIIMGYIEYSYLTLQAGLYQVTLKCNKLLNAELHGNFYNQ